MNLKTTEVQRLSAAASRLGRTRILAIAGIVAALAVALVVWSQGDGGLVWSLFVGVAVVLFAANFGLGGTAFVLALRHREAEAARWSMKSLWFLVAGVGVVILGVALG